MPVTLKLAISAFFLLTALYFIWRIAIGIRAELREIRRLKRLFQEIREETQRRQAATEKYLKNLTLLNEGRAEEIDWNND